MNRRSTTEAVAAHRARLRAAGLRATEAVLHEREIELLDGIKARLGLASRSDAMRVMLAKVDPDSLTPADADVLNERAA